MALSDSVVERQCRGKVGYASMPEAIQVAKLMHKRVKAKFNPYECPWCKRFHVGTHRSEHQRKRRVIAAVTAAPTDSPRYQT